MIVPDDTDSTVNFNWFVEFWEQTLSVFRIDEILIGGVYHTTHNSAKTFPDKMRREERCVYNQQPSHVKTILYRNNVREGEHMHTLKLYKDGWYSNQQGNIHTQTWLELRVKFWSVI